MLVREFERTHVPLNRGFHRDTWVCSLGYPSSPLSPAAKSREKPQEVRFLSSPLKNHGFPRVFRISGQLLWPSVAPMLARCMASCGACISRRAAQIESFFESRDSPKHWGFNVPRFEWVATCRRGHIFCGANPRPID
jgi:hypothetical protein